MRGSYVASLAASLALAASVSAAAGTLSTGFIYWHNDDELTSCTVTNIGSKPITITSVSLIDDDSTALVPLDNGCTTAPLAPNGTCFWHGDVETFGGKLEFKGPAKSLRGRCFLRSSTTGEVLGPAADLR
jgi:hypothetical protein